MENSQTKNYYGVIKNVYKENGSYMPEETLVLPEIFETEEEAVRFMMKECDKEVLFYHYDFINETSYRFEVKNQRTGKSTFHRVEFEQKTFTLQ